MSEIKFKVGAGVKMSPMWKYETAFGSVIKITREYIVVRWNDINGEWHYTHAQAQKLHLL